MKLYELSEQFKGLSKMIDESDLPDDYFQDTIDAINAEFEEKAKQCLFVRQNLIGQAAAIEAEINRLNALCGSINKNIDKITDYIECNMIAVEKDKMDLGLFKLTLRKASKKLGDIDESKIDDKFWIVVPETKKLDKRALLAAAKESDIDGVEIAYSERSLTIK